MALNVTLSYLKDQVRARADQQNSQFVSDAELTAYINGSASALYDILVAASEDYYVQDVDIPIIPGQKDYDLPANFYKVLGIDYTINSRPIAMSRFNWKERNFYNILNLRPEIARYAIMGSKIMFRPQEPKSPSVKVWYVPSITTLVTDNDVLDGVNGWEEYVILDAAIKCMVKEESDPAALMTQLQMVEKRIVAMSKDRDQGEPRTTTDSVGARQDRLRSFDYGVY